MVVSFRQTHLIRGEELEVVRRVRDDVPLATRVARRTRVPKPIQPNAQHSKLLESGHEQVPVLPRLTELSQRTVVQRYLPHAAPVPVGQAVGGAVASPQPGSFRQDQLQLGRRAAGDQRPDQRQRVLVEVGLQENSSKLLRVRGDAAHR